MNKLIMLVLALLSTPLFANEVSLENRMKALDAALFESFNHCHVPEELNKYASYFDPDVEFYHDNGGVTWERNSMLLNTKNNVCGNFTRQLVAHSFKAYPIKSFGAITEGTHIFCQNKTKKCEGKADFIMVWRNVDNNWQVTRVLSYGHREN